MARKERGLGRGLEALLSPEKTDSAHVIEIDVQAIIPHSGQPRKYFDDEALQELASSIKEHGILQPVLVRQIGLNYEIIAGERRWRAAELAGVQYIPALIKEISDREAAEISLVENLQREELSAVEEARAYKQLLENYQYTQEQIADRIGKSRTYIANTVRLLQLGPEILEMLEKRQISPGHARALLALRSSREQIAAANEIIRGKLSVRQVEQKAKQRAPQKGAVNKGPELLELEERLQSHFGTRVEINRQKRGGKIEIAYYDEDDLDRIIELLEF